MSTVTLTLQLPNGEQLLYQVPTRETAGAHQHECALYCHHRKAINALIREKLNLEPNTVSIMLHHNLEEEHQALRKWYDEFFLGFWPELTPEQHAKNLHRILYDRGYGWYAYGRNCLGTCYQTDTVVNVDIFPKVKVESPEGAVEDEEMDVVSDDEE